jgi:type IV fimbrial biogenesis protein FimT
MSTPYKNRSTQISSLGFTLVELLVALAVFSILLSLAAPSSRNMVTNSRLSTQTNEMVTFFSLARTEALKRSTEVRVIPVDSLDWSRGMSIIADANKDGDFTDPGDIIRIASALEGASSLTADGTNNLSNPYVTFNSRGALQPTGDTFSFLLSPPVCTGQQTRLITVVTTGHPSSTRQNCP